MALGQYSVIVAGMAGACLFLHLISAGNFRPDDEVWFISNLFWYLHYWLNTCARLTLLAVAAVLGVEIYAPGTIARNTSVRNSDLAKHITKMLAGAVFCIFIRFILPGPVTSFGMFYKLSFIIAMSAAALSVVATGGNRPKPTATTRTPSRTDSDKSSEDGERRLGKSSFKSQ